MSTSPDIAVVIPARDAAPTLAAALASILAQTLQPRLVVVIDDGSVDATPRLLRDWAEMLPMTCLATAGLGPGPARALGVDEAITAGCSWIALLDADDVLLPNHLEVLWANRRPTGSRQLVIGDGFLWFPDGQTAMLRHRTIAGVPSIDRLKVELHVRNCVFVGSMFSAAAYRAAGGFRDIRAGEDWDLWRRMVIAGCEVGISPHATYLYRQRSEATMWTRAGLEGAVVAARYAVAEAPDQSLRRVAHRTLRRAQAEVRLFEAYEAGDARQRWRARRLALRALHGRRSVALRALMTFVAPQWTSRLRRQRRQRSFGRPA